MRAGFKEELTFVSYSRVLAMFFVIFVHLCQQSNFSLVVASAQFFITGVTIFIILSGYLYGVKAKDEHYPESERIWLADRGKRILKPYYFVVFLILFFDFIMYGESSIVKKLGMFLLCIQDFCGSFFYSIRGTGHLWYITMLILCYLFTVVLFKARSRFVKWGGEILLSLYIIQIVITLFVHPKVGRYFFYLTLYISAFCIAYIKKKSINITENVKWLFLTGITVVLWLYRLLLYFRGCDSNVYNYLYAYYTQGLMSIWFIYSLYLLCKKGVLKNNVILKKLDSISYEVFLIHYAFIVGPFKLIGLFDNLIFESILVIVFSLVCGTIISLICKGRYLKIV